VGVWELLEQTPKNHEIQEVDLVGALGLLEQNPRKPEVLEVALMEASGLWVVHQQPKQGVDLVAALAFFGQMSPLVVEDVLEEVWEFGQGIGANSLDLLENQEAALQVVEECDMNHILEMLLVMDLEDRQCSLEDEEKEDSAVEEKLQSLTQDFQASRLAFHIHTPLAMMEKLYFWSPSISSAVEQWNGTHILVNSIVMVKAPLFV
jgi:hypothetical protein